MKRIADSQTNLNIVMVAVVVVVALVGVVSMLNNNSGAVVVNSGSELTGRASYECWFSCLNYYNVNGTDDPQYGHCTSTCGF